MTQRDGNAVPPTAPDADGPTLDLSGALSGMAASAGGPAPGAGAAAARRTAARRRVARVTGVAATAVAVAVAAPLAITFGDVRFQRVDVLDGSPAAPSGGEETLGAPVPLPIPSAEPTATPATPDDPEPLPEASADPGETSDGVAPRESTPTGASAGQGGGPEGPVAAAPPAFVADAGPEAGGGSPGSAVLVDVRTGLNEGYDRVVFEYAGPGTPAWDVRYVSAAVGQGGGAVPLAGDATLAVVLTGVDDGAVEPEGGWPGGEAPAQFPMPSVVPAPATLVVTEAESGRLVDGRQDAFIGLRAEQPFRVFTLTSPSRVVVDVLHP